MRESAGLCYICKTELFRDEEDKFFIHPTVGAVCIRHNGVAEEFKEVMKQRAKEILENN